MKISPADREVVSRRSRRFTQNLISIKWRRAHRSFNIGLNLLCVNLRDLRETNAGDKTGINYIDMKKIVIALFTITLSLTLLSFQKKPAFDLKASIGRGKEIYLAQCVTCHLEAGEGIEGVYPPLAKSDYLMTDKKRAITQVIKGANGPIKVNGKAYDGEMTSFDLNDQEVSDVLNYIRNSWGNKGEAVRPDEVKAARI